MPERRPCIAVLLDENTSGDATRYEASKAYFRWVHAAGGVPFGIPFLTGMADDILARSDGLLCTGGRFAYPERFYVDGHRSRSPPSDRPAIEAELVRAFLDRRMPVLGICAGMQMLGCLHGARMLPDTKLIGSKVAAHDGPGLRHDVSVIAGSRLAGIVGALRFKVNSLHREAIVEVPDRVRVAATAADGVIEAIEIPEHRFAIGLQWHQEAFVGTPHPGNALADAFVAACGHRQEDTLDIRSDAAAARRI